MEVLTIIIGVAVFFISALIIYCISVFSMREKTFEEVMEEQRRRQEEEREKAKAEKKAEREIQKKKYKKGKQDKVKEKSAQVTEPELKDLKMVNLEIEPEIIEPAETFGLNSALRQRGKKEKTAKPILHNKGEITLVSEKTVEIQHKPIVPKDELELKKSHEKIDKIKMVHTEPQVHLKETVIHKEIIKENLPPKKTEKEEIKVKQTIDDADKHPVKPRPVSDEGALNGSKLISSVKSANLSDSEVQTLIDILLNRQGVSPITTAVSETWNKKSQKGDPISQLKKQLEEKEKSLQEEQNLLLQSNNKLKELQKELSTEKTKYVALDKRLLEKSNQHKSEIEALQLRMQHSHEQSLSEINMLQARVCQLNEQGNAAGDRITTGKLSEENKILQETLSQKIKEVASLSDRIKHLERELNNSKNTQQSSDSNKKSLESKISQYEEKISKLETAQKETDSLVCKRVDEITSELNKAEIKNVSLSADLQKATSSLSAAQEECSSLKAKLKELEIHLTKAEASKEVEARLQESEQKRSELDGNIKNLEKQLDELSKRFNESKTEVASLQVENKNLLDEIRLVNERLQSYPASNGDIHENGSSISTSEQERIMANKNQEILELTVNLEGQKKVASTLQTQLDNKSAEISDLQQQLISQKTKNNELREKNWKAMEALEIAEKTSAEKVDKALKSAREIAAASVTELETYDKFVFQRLFPEVQISDKLSHKEWVVTFEKLAVKNLQNAGVEKIAQLENENSKLKSEVNNYHSIVSETENKLHQLEKTIDAEQKKWQEELTKAHSVPQQDTLLLQKVRELETLISQQASQIEEYRNILANSVVSLMELEKKVTREEKSWLEKYSLSQTQLCETKDQLSRLKQEAGKQNSQEDLSDLCFAYHCVEKSLTSIVDELQLKIIKLECELKEAQDKLSVIKTEETLITQSESQIVSSSSDLEVLQKQINELQNQLESERKKTKELSLNVIKLNGIIKTGQDALAQEQGLVKKLQESLDSKSMSCGHSEAEEAEQLRFKLSEKQKLLEREMATNKQLSERLAQLGMLAANTDGGTSV